MDRNNSKILQAFTLLDEIEFVDEILHTQAFELFKRGVFEGEDINTTGKDGRNGLFHACDHDLKSMIRFCIARGINIQHRVNENYSGKSLNIFQWCIMDGAHETLTFILEKCREYNIALEEGQYKEYQNTARRQKEDARKLENVEFLMPPNDQGPRSP